MDLTNCAIIQSELSIKEALLKHVTSSESRRNTEIENRTNAEISQLKKEYSSLGCGKDLESESCINLDSEIQSLISTISDQMKLAVNDSRYNSTVESLKKKLAQLKLDYETKGCIAKVQKVQLESANEVVSQFTSLDEARIEEQASYQVKQRVFFGGLVLIAGLFILTAFNSKNK